MPSFKTTLLFLLRKKNQSLVAVLQLLTIRSNLLKNLMEINPPIITTITPAAINPAVNAVVFWGDAVEDVLECSVVDVGP